MSLIGEGAYGCVYLPSLTCKKKHVKKYYTDKISKATTFSNAINEIKQQEYIDNNIDPKFKYHISPPVNCVPDLSIKSNVKQLKECDALKKDDGKLIPKKEIALLIMNNGGIDLKKFATYLTYNPHSPLYTPSDMKLTESTYYKQLNEKNKPKIIIDFWRKSIILINALDDFAKNKTMHHDLKPENIVYDHIKKRFNIIDYGLSRKYEEYHSNIAHFSYPPETYVLNPSVYNIVSNASNKEFKHILGIDPINENTTFMDSYKYFMLYIIINDYTDDSKYGFKTKQDILSIFNTNLYKGKTLNEIQHQSMITHDMYGMGLALMYIFVRTFFYLRNTDGILNEKFIKKMYNILFSMVHPNCFERPTINNLKQNYEKTLLLLGQRSRSTANSKNKTSLSVRKNTFTRRSKNN